MLPWTLTHKLLCGRVLSVLLGVSIGLELLGCV